MRTTKSPHLFSLIQGILATCGIDIPAGTGLSQLRLSVFYKTFENQHLQTGPLQIETVSVSMNGSIGSITLTCTDGSQLLLCTDSSAKIPHIFRDPHTRNYDCNGYTLSVAPMEAAA